MFNDFKLETGRTKLLVYLILWSLSFRRMETKQRNCSV